MLQLNKSVILASGSPRRKALLKHIIENFEVKTKNTDESFPKDLPVDQVAEYISQKKALAFKHDVKSNELYITADTVVCIDNKILGKPKNKQQAISFLKQLQGKTHYVITGVTLLTADKQSSFSQKTKITFSALNNTEIEFYIDQFKPFDKAGAYAIQEWIGAVGIEKIEGDYYNVVGLPVNKVYQKLKAYSV